MRLYRSEQIRPGAGNGDDCRIGKRSSQRPDQSQPINVRHVKICDDDINAFSKLEIEGLQSIRCDIYLVTEPLDDVLHDDPIGRFVFDDEYACHD